MNFFFVIGIDPIGREPKLNLFDLHMGEVTDDVRQEVSLWVSNFVEKLLGNCRLTN